MSRHIIQVVNKDGNVEKWQTTKIIERLNILVNSVHGDESPARILAHVDHELIAIETIKRLPTTETQITTKDIDQISAGVCANMIDVHREYDEMAARIAIACHHKHTLDTFSEKIELLDGMLIEIANLHKTETTRADLLNAQFVNFVKKHEAKINAKIDYSRDYLITYSGFLTLLSSYLLKTCEKKVVERPQDMFMRVAIGIYIKTAEQDFDKIFEIYDFMSTRYCTHATPTLYNAGLNIGQLSSCFLLGSDDSTPGIMKTASDCAEISKRGGGVGFHTNWRSRNSYIRGTNGSTNGKFSFIEVHGSVSKAFDQGGNKRKGSFAMYEWMHDADIEVFIDMWRISGSGDKRNREIYIAVWIPDLFMRRLQEDGDWSLFSYDQCPELYNSYGEEYEAIYARCEKNPKLVRAVVKARELFRKIYDTQVESGMPYILYGDSANRFSNQKNLGTIRSSNLCSEIIMYSDTKEYGVCNLASICLGRLVEDHDGIYRQFPEKPHFNYELLIRIVKLLVNTLNAVIDNNVYPVPEAELSNLRHRPIGIGVQGLANVFAMFGLSWDSKEASIINKKIFETIYYAAINESCSLAQKREKQILAELKLKGSVTVHGKVYTSREDLPKCPGGYSSFNGSPLSEGILRWQASGLPETEIVLKYDWQGIIQKIMRYGVWNSLHIALMPTASTSTIMDQVESIEPFKTNYNVKSVKSGTILKYNQFLFNDLEKLGCANSDVFQHILANNGSVKNIVGLPESIKKKYKTAYEIDPRVLLQLAIDRQHFVDQSQSFNWFLDQSVDYNLFKKLQITAWKGKMITGAYYTHRFAPSDALKFTIRDSIVDSINIDVNYDDDYDGDVCLSCGS